MDDFAQTLDHAALDLVNVVSASPVSGGDRLWRHAINCQPLEDLLGLFMDMIVCEKLSHSDFHRGIAPFDVRRVSSIVLRRRGLRKAKALLERSFTRQLFATF